MQKCRNIDRTVVLSSRQTFNTHPNIHGELPFIIKLILILGIKFWEVFNAYLYINQTNLVYLVNKFFLWIKMFPTSFLNNRFMVQVSLLYIILGQSSQS